jgi:hypothetical protein
MRVGRAGLVLSGRTWGRIRRGAVVRVPVKEQGNCRRGIFQNDAL